MNVCRRNFRLRYFTDSIFLIYTHNKIPIDLSISHFFNFHPSFTRWRLEERQRRLLLRLKRTGLIDELIGKRKRLYWILCRIHDKKDGRPFRWIRNGNNAFIEMSLMKYEKLEIGPIDTKLFFNNRKFHMREWKFWSANYRYMIYIICLKYAFLFSIRVYSDSENLFHVMHKERMYERCTKGVKRNGKTIKLCLTNHSSAHRRRTVIIGCIDDAR